MITSWDIETSTRERFKRKGSPWHPENVVVAQAFKVAGTPGIMASYYGRKHPAPGWLRPVLQGAKILAGVNIKFDLLWALQDKDNLDAWMEWVAAGGNVWDCQLAEYLLDGMVQESHMLSMDELAPRYGGDLKVDEVKALWAAGVMTEDIDPDLLMRYLTGGEDELGRPQKGDIGNTEAICLGQIKRAKAQGQVNSLMLNMGSLLCTIEMERNGMFVDMGLATKLADELRAKLGELEAGLAAFLPPDLPFQFKWTSPFHKSALIFGGTVKWDGYEYDLADGGTIYKHVYDVLEVKPERVYAMKEETHYLLTDGTSVPTAAGVLPEIQALLVRNKSGKNAGEPKTKKVKVPDLTKPKGRAAKVPHQFPGYTHPNKEWERSDYPGVYSTASEVIELLGNRDIPFLKALAAVQEATKDLSTYYIVTDEHGNSKGMLSLVGGDGVVHHRINHTSTVTGRFSSSDPNLQNIPKGSFDEATGKQKGSQIKRAFVSRFDGGVICQSDFTALEVYVQAVLTQCTQLIEDLKAGLDMHCVRVAQKEKRDYQEVVNLCKGYTNANGVWVDADPEWDRKRTKAKTFSFQRAYGAGAAKIAESTGMSIEEVEALIAAENERYPEIDEYYEGLTERIRRARKPGITVPHPFVRGVMCQLGTSQIATPDGKRYSYREQPAPEYLVKRGTTSSFSPTEIKNYVVQGEGGEWAKAAMWLAVRAFYKRKNFGHKALLVNQVHDAVYGDFDGNVKDEAAALLHACMEGASDFMEYWFQWKVAVPVPSDTTYGHSMMDENRIPGVKDSAKPLREQLRAEYMNGYVPSFIN